MSIWILSLLLVVGFPNFALDSAQLLGIPSAKLIAAVPPGVAVAILLVVVVRCLQDRVVLCLHVARVVVRDDVLGERIVAVVVLV